MISVGDGDGQDFGCEAVCCEDIVRVVKGQCREGRVGDVCIYEVILPRDSYVLDYIKYIAAKRGVA